MEYRAHVAKQMPILEDALAGIAILVERGTDADPCIRLDTLGLEIRDLAPRNPPAQHAKRGDQPMPSCAPPK